MKPNINALDRLIRLSIGAIGVLLIATNVVAGVAAYIIGGLSFIFFATAFFRFCPLYKLVGITTCRTK